MVSGEIQILALGAFTDCCCQGHTVTIETDARTASMKGRGGGAVCGWTMDGALSSGANG
jgi:hypothetical protein